MSKVTDFEHGIIFAACVLYKTYGQSSMAAQILSEAGIADGVVSGLPAWEGMILSDILKTEALPLRIEEHPLDASRSTEGELLRQVNLGMGWVGDDH